MPDNEPTVKGSWPLVRLIDGVPHWHIEGTHPPQYARDEALERVWRERNGMQTQSTAIKLLHGDCRAILPTLAPRSVQTIITSPPYFGLRDYGITPTAWPEIEYTPMPGLPSVTVPAQTVCLGLESDPLAYTAHLVHVFRLARPALADDGTAFLNIGDAYFGSSQTGGTKSKEGSSKRSGRMFNHRADTLHAQSYGNDDTTVSDSPMSDSISRNLCGEHKDSEYCRILGICLHRAAEQVHEFCLRILAYMEEQRAHLPIADYWNQQPTVRFSFAILDRLLNLIREALPALSFHQSKQLESYQQHQDGFPQWDTLLAFLLSLHSFSSCAQEFVHRSGALVDGQYYTDGISVLYGELARRTRYTSECCLLVLSWLKPSHIQPHCTTGGLKKKDLMLIPARVALALQADGWYVRSQVIWWKPNAMPESVTDRLTNDYEPLYLLAKSPRYYFDQAAIAESAKRPGDVQTFGANKGRAYTPAADDPNFRNGSEQWGRTVTVGETRNRRAVWRISTEALRDEHYAPMPEALVEPCILAGSKPGDTVLDMFFGSGTVGRVALKYGRRCIGIDLNQAYLGIQERRTNGVQIHMEAYLSPNESEAA